MRVISGAFAVLASTFHGYPPSTVRLVRVEAHLFYEGSGRLSEDLLVRAKPFEEWNTIIGEGDAEENANDMLVMVFMAADKLAETPETIVESSVEATVRDGFGKILAARKWNSVLTSRAGTVVLPLWVRDVGCAGNLRITARYNGKIKTGRLDLPCGE